MFTGQTKELFEKWYNEKHDDDIFFLVGEHSFNPAVEFFDIMPFNHRSGVYLQFLREQGISITIRFGLSAGYYCEISEDDESDDIVLTDFESYDTALTAGITKAGELLNERGGK